MAAQNNKPQTILIAFLAFIGLGLTSGLLGVAWPYIQKNFTLSLDAVNLLLLVQTISYTLASFSLVGSWRGSAVV